MGKFEVNESYGEMMCDDYDKDQHPLCEGTNMPDWCSTCWCFVDYDMCSANGGEYNGAALEPFRIVPSIAKASNMCTQPATTDACIDPNGCMKGNNVDIEISFNVNVGPKHETTVDTNDT